MAEAFLLPAFGQELTLIAVRVLDLAWNVQVSELLIEAFGLTRAETEVARTLLEEGDTGRVAEKRGVSVLTVRTQLRTIFSRTETGNQVDLIRLLSMVCARAVQGEGSEEGGWQDPLFNERSFTDNQGRKISYSWMGAKAGVPMILIHDPMTGYALAPEIRQKKAENNITLWTVCRLGLGHSDPDEDHGARVSGMRTIAALMDHLAIERCPFVTLASGMVPTVSFAAQSPNRVSAILALGGCHPLDTKTTRKHLPPNHRVFLSLARFSAGAAEFAALAGYRILRQKGFVFALQRIFSNCEPDAETMRDTDKVSMLSASMGMVTAQGHRAWWRDTHMMIDEEWRDDLLATEMPIHMLHGVQDPIYKLEHIQELADQRDGVIVQAVSEAGQLVAHQFPELTANALVDLVKA